MKKFIVAGVIGMIGLSSCGDGAKTVEKEAVDTTPNVEVVNVDGLKIAFYNQDSLKVKFDYYKERDEVMTQKGLAFQKEIARRTKEFENYVIRNEEKARQGILSENEMIQIQQNIQMKDAELMRYQQERGAALEKETIDELTVLGNKIQEWANQYCEENGIDLLLIQANGGQFGYIKPSMDVTEAFTNYLNEQQSAIENDESK